LLLAVEAAAVAMLVTVETLAVGTPEIAGRLVVLGSDETGAAMTALAIMAAMVQAKAFIVNDVSNEWTVGYAQEKRVERMVLIYSHVLCRRRSKKNDWGH
jgi:hypothetical protein